MILSPLKTNWGLQSFVPTRSSGRGAPAPFDPLSYFSAGQKGFIYDMTDPTTVWQDDLRTIPASVDNVVGGITDLSPNGNHARQSNSSKKPIYRSDGSIDHDGVDDIMEGFPTYESDEYTMGYSMNTSDTNGFYHGTQAYQGIGMFSMSFRTGSGAVYGGWSFTGDTQTGRRWVDAVDYGTEYGSFAIWMERIGGGNNRRVIYSMKRTYAGAPVYVSIQGYPGGTFHAAGKVWRAFAVEGFLGDADMALWDNWLNEGFPA